MDESTERRIMLLGKTGSGKSSLGNTILNKEERFQTSSSSKSKTKKCDFEIININGKNIKLVDLPGIFDTDQKSPDLSPELIEGLKECAPGPHAFLIVLKVERYTLQEEAVVDTILKYFSEEALKYTTVVFTHGDELDKGVKIKDWVDENEALRSLVQKCEDRCHVFDNKYWNDSKNTYRNNQVQVTELLRTIEETVEKNGGGYYTSSFWQKIKLMINKNIPLNVLLGLAFGAAAPAAAAAAAAMPTVAALVMGAVTSAFTKIKLF